MKYYNAYKYTTDYESPLMLMLVEQGIDDDARDARLLEGACGQVEYFTELYMEDEGLTEEEATARAEAEVLAEWEWVGETCEHAFLNK